MIPKNAGFKPIGQNSLSLKKFFPGDEEDMDISSDMSVVADAEQEPSINNHAPEQPYTEKLAHSTSNTIADDQPLHRMPSSPLAASRSSSVVMEDEPPEPAAELRMLTPLQTPKQPDPDLDNTGASTPHSRSELYAIVSQVGEGTFGKVYKAQNTVTKRYVALKRIRMESEKEGFPVTAMREIKLLQSLSHENIVRLYEMMVSNGSVYMVFEYLEHDLTGILSQTQYTFQDAHLKSLNHQMLAGLAYLHHKGVIHRDIKGSNILLNNRGELKLGDFGLARFYQKRRRTDYTNRVITLWYRPPELLFGATVYGPEVDMWSAGCIMLELFTKKPVFQGNDEIHQLDTIYKVIGTPTADRWPDVVSLPWYELVKPRDEIPNNFRELFRKWMSPGGLDLAERLLCYDPAARATAAQALEAPYFTQEDPPALPPVGLATLHGEWHELDTKRERARKRKKE
ncbi:Pkinase-domain-containing protein [Mycena sanguinolenta]|nr:Pkinase-domain-containing protein [Mycena sanguinolenta]